MLISEEKKTNTKAKPLPTKTTSTCTYQKGLWIVVQTVFATLLSGCIAILPFHHHMQEPRFETRVVPKMLASMSVKPTSPSLRLCLSLSTSQKPKTALIYWLNLCDAQTQAFRQACNSRNVLSASPFVRWWSIRHCLCPFVPAQASL